MADGCPSLGWKVLNMLNFAVPQLCGHHTIPYNHYLGKIQRYVLNRVKSALHSFLQIFVEGHRILQPKTLAHKLQLILAFQQSQDKPPSFACKHTSLTQPTYISPSQHPIPQYLAETLIISILFPGPE